MKLIRVFVVISIINLVATLLIIPRISRDGGVETVSSDQSDRCLVTVNGVKYDLTELKETHTGGDIFVCDSDMTQVFWEQHDQIILDQMAKYKI